MMILWKIITKDDVPDSNYENLTVNVTLQPGSQYEKLYVIHLRYE